MQRPFFSVIIPTLNEEVCLRRLLRNLSQQVFRPFEVIVVDGYSEDKTIQVARKYASSLSIRLIESKIRDLRHQRNLGVRYAQGTYLILLESDDQLLPDFLEQLYSIILASKALFMVIYIKSDDSRIFFKFLAFFANILIEIANRIGYPFSGGFNTVVKRKIYLKVGGFREHLSISDDHDFSTRVCKAGYPLTIVRNPHIIYSFRRYRSKGILPTVWIYTYAAIHFIFKGPIEKKQFEFKMGGHIHVQNKKKLTQSRFGYMIAYKPVENMYRVISHYFHF